MQKNRNFLKNRARFGILTADHLKMCVYCPNQTSFVYFDTNQHTPITDRLSIVGLLRVCMRSCTHI